MKNCNCKDKEVTPCNDKCVIRQMIDECSGNKINYITLASAVLMECNDTETVKDVLNEIQGKLNKIDNHIDEYTWDAIIAFLKNNITRLEPELTNLINSRIENYFLHNDFAGLKQLFRQLFAEWETTFTNLINRIGQGISREELNQILSEYAKKTEIPNLDAYLTKNEAQTLYQPKGNYLTEHQDLSEYAKKSDIPEGQDLSAYVKTIKVNGNSFNPTNGITDLGNLTDNVRMQYEEQLSRNTDNEIVFPMGAQVKSMYLYTQEEYDDELFEFQNGQIYTKYEIGYIFGITKASVYELPDVKDRVLMQQLSNYSYDSDYNSSGFKSLEGESINLIFNKFEYRSLSSEDKENATEISEGGSTRYSLPIELTYDILHKFHKIVKSNESMFLYLNDHSKIDFTPIGNSYDSEQRLGTPIRLSETVLKKSSKGQLTDNIIELRNNSVYYDSAHKCFFVYIKQQSDERIIPISNSIIVNENSKFDDLQILHTIFGLQLTLNCTNIKDDGSKTKTLIPLTYFTGALIQGSVLTDYSKDTTLNPVVYTASFSKDESGNTVYTLNQMELFGQRCTPTGEGQQRCITKVPNSGNDEP